MTAINKKGPGAPTHVLVDMLGHPAVELTQAEDAVGSNGRGDLAAPAAVSGSEDVIVLIIGILAGCASCAILLSVVCLFVQRRTRSRSFMTTRLSNGNEISSSTKTKDKKMIVVKDLSVSDGSVLGTTSSEYFEPNLKQSTGK